MGIAMCARKQADMMLHIEDASKISLYQQIYEQIRDAIMAGNLVEGQKLTSIRRLSDNLGVSHTTVEQAYLQLAVEGYVENVPRSGYVVLHVDTDYMALERAIDEAVIRDAREARSHDAFFAENRSGAGAVYDFSYANLQPDSFPATTWRKLVSDVLYRNDSPELARYSHTDETGSLGMELASYLARTRGVHCFSDQVVVQAGTDGALATLLQLFDRERDVLGMEEPGYATVREVATRLGFGMAPIPSDQGIEALFAALDEHEPRIVFTTPSHQFPTGTLLPLEARTRLLKWAEEHDAFIIEDDSCNEYRYATRPVPSLQSLDAFDRVVYLNNVSKVLSPSLRIAYIVLPPKLLERYWDVFNYAHPPVSWLEQEVLARFIAQGHWDSQVRRMATSNHRNHDELLRCLKGAFGDSVRISGTDTGMHLYVTVLNGMTQDELIASALSEGVKVYGTKRMWFSKPAPENNVMIGFSAIPTQSISPGIAALRRAWLPNS